MIRKAGNDASEPEGRAGQSPLALQKELRVTEFESVEMRGDAFDTFNRAELYDPLAVDSNIKASACRPSVYGCCSPTHPARCEGGFPRNGFARTGQPNAAGIEPPAGRLV